MTLFSRWVLAGGILVAAIFFAGCSSEEGDQQGYFWPTVGNPGTNTTVATFVVGDTITVTLQGPEMPPPPHVEAINDDGTLDMPEIGHVKAAGKTPGELQNEIHDLYVPKYFNQLSVSVTCADRVYYVTGEVKSPARQIYLGETTLTKAITSSGDFTDFANRHSVLLIRGQHKLKVDCAKIFDDPQLDLLVYPGDEIKVYRRAY